MIRPIGNYVLVKKEKEEENKKVNGIIMTPTALNAMTSLKRGEVVAVGDGTVKDGIQYPIKNVLVGNNVLWSGMGFDIDNDMTLISHESIVAVDDKTDRAVIFQIIDANIQSRCRIPHLTMSSASICPLCGT